MPLKNGKPGSPRWRKAGRPAKMPKAEPEVIIDRTPEEHTVMTPEQMVAAAAPAAIQAIIAIMRKPGRNAAAQLRAAETLMRYGVQEPAKAQTITSDTTHRLEGDINIVLVEAKDGKRA